MDEPNISHPLRQLQKRAPKGAFFVVGGEGAWTNARGFDKFVRNEFGQPNGWPEARSAEGEGHG